VYLTRRQAEVLRLAARGLSGKQIARHLGISVRTVEDYFSAMRQQTRTHSRGELIAYAVAAGLVKPGPPIPETVLPRPAGAGSRRGTGIRSAADRPRSQRRVDNQALRTRDAGDHAKRRPAPLPGAGQAGTVNDVTGHPEPGAGKSSRGMLNAVVSAGHAEPASACDVLAALHQVIGERERLDRTERELIDMARRHGVTWSKIGGALGVGTAQAAQQRRKRLGRAPRSSPWLGAGTASGVSG
jgi:DNA-binding CsgD family transcriptional regulator